MREISPRILRDVIAKVTRRQVRPLSEGPRLSAAGRLTRHQIDGMPEPIGITWLYPWAVTLYGLIRSSGTADDGQGLAFAKAHNQLCARYFVWLKALDQQLDDPQDIADTRQASKLRFLLRLANSNDCGAMANQMLECILRDPASETPEQIQVLNHVADWILHRQHRLPDGTFVWRSTQTEGQTVGLGDVVWPDDLFMNCPFLVRWARFTANPALVEDAAWQIVRQAQIMQGDDGIWAHGYFWDRQAPAPHHWGRAGAWALLATLEVLDVLEPGDRHREALLAIVRRQISGLAALQTPNGLWRQIIDDPHLWEETSSSAMFAYGIARAVNAGWIEPKWIEVALRAFEGIATQINPDGVIRNCCTGTDISLDLEYYAARPHPDDEPHGPGPVLLAASELLRFQDCRTRRP